MNFLDIIFIVLLCLAFIYGFRKGLIIELATFAALLLGIWAGFHFSELVSGLIEDATDYEGKYINIISFIIVVIVVIVLVQILARVLTKFVKAIALGLLNKIAGGLFAILKAALILSVLIYFINRFDENHRFISDTKRDHSLLFPVVEGIAPLILPGMKEYTRQWIHREKNTDGE